jgi:hypothetical protein
MDFSKLKIDLYEFLGLIIPGLLLIWEIVITIAGWGVTFAAAKALTGATLTMLLFAGFAAGHVLQELADFVIKKWKGDRFFKKGRDKFWQSADGEDVRNCIRNECGVQIESVDNAFEYCLAKVQGAFAKRDAFIATADLCRAMALLFMIGILPLWRVVHVLNSTRGMRYFVFGCGIATLFASAVLCWRRMLRFREFTEKPVFTTYLAQVSREKAAPQKA